MNAAVEILSVRIDVWLWAARFFKTRALAKAAVELHRVRIADQPLKPSRQVRVGEVLRIERGEEVFEVEVRGLSEQRGGASIAQELYLESDSSRTARSAAREQRRFEALGYRAPEGKPDKRARRLIHALGDLDMS